MTHASLFSGVGGFDLAAEWMGWTNAFHCEIKPFCRRILNYYWPDAHSYADITQTDFTRWEGRIDVLSGGPPCQPYSVAGEQLGTADERHLWPEMLRAIREIEPRWVVCENVRGIVGWSNGLVFETLHTDLEREGYEVQAFVLPAAGVGEEHRRERMFLVAHAAAYRVEGHAKEPFQRQPDVPCCPAGGRPQNVRKRPSEGQYLHGGVRDGISNRLYNECIEGYGNAVVPQVILQLFKTIHAYDNPAFLN